MLRKLSTVAFLAGAVGVSGSSLAVDQLQMDLNSLNTTGAVGFSVTYTGSISIDDDAETVLNDILLDGLSAGGFVSGALIDFSGSITFNSGTVTGGSFSVEAYTDNTFTTTSTYTATIRANSGDINDQAGQGFSIDGLTFDGAFSDTMFAGVDVTAWDINEPLRGSFIEFAFNPNAGGVDDDSNMDLFVVVPLPTAAGLGVLGIGALAVRRRRTA